MAESPASSARPASSISTQTSSPGFVGTKAGSRSVDSGPETGQEATSSVTGGVTGELLDVDEDILEGGKLSLPDEGTRRCCFIRRMGTWGRVTMVDIITWPLQPPKFH